MKGCLAFLVSVLLVLSQASTAGASITIPASGATVSGTVTIVEDYSVPVTSSYGVPITEPPYLHIGVYDLSGGEVASWWKYYEGDPTPLSAIWNASYSTNGWYTIKSWISGGYWNCGGGWGGGGCYWTGWQYDVSAIQVHVNNNTAPTAGYSLSTSNPNEGQTVYFYDASSDAQGNITSYYWDFGDGAAAYGANVSHAYGSPGLKSGWHRVFDSGGLPSTSYFSVNVGNLAPVVTGIGNNGPVVVGSPATITVNAYDPGGVEAVSFHFDCNYDGTFDVASFGYNHGSCTFSSTGSFTVLVRAADPQGAYSQSTTVVTVQPPPDMAPPVTTATVAGTAGNDGWYLSNVEVSLSAADNAGGSGVSKIEYSLDGVNLNAYGGPFTVSAEGATTVYFRSWDNAGNTEATQTRPIKIDKTPPAIVGTRSPAPNGNGWNNGDVTVSFTCSDGGSGMDSCSASTTLAIEGANQRVVGTAVDKAGNSASATVANINIDKTPPTISGSRTPAAHGNGWNNTDVAVHFEAGDTLSGVASVTPDTVASTEGKGQTVVGTATDKAGNSASTTVGNISIDKTPPTLSFGVQSPAANANGWNNSDVSLPFTPADNLSGVAGTNPTASPLVLSAEGTSVTVRVTVTDLAGNSATFTSPAVRIDKTAPAISGSRTPNANANGWNNSDVIVSFTCTDGLSDVASCSGPTMLSGEGANQSVTGTATDRAGNTASAAVDSINIDKTPPAIIGSRMPGPNANGWNNSNVTVHFEAGDGLSGLSSLTPDTVMSTEAANQSLTGTAVDKAGNPASTTVGNVSIDKTPPSIAINSPTVGPYLTSQSITIDFSRTDGLSGINSTSATLDGNTVANGQVVNLAGMAGSHTFVVTTTDRAGNTTTRSVTFVVRIAATVDVKPDTLNLGRQSDKNAVTAYVEFPAGYDVKLVNVATLTLTANGVSIPALSSPTAVGDYDGDKVTDAMAKFDRQAVINALGSTSEEVTMVVSGQLSDGRVFVGSDVVRVIARGK